MTLEDASLYLAESSGRRASDLEAVYLSARLALEPGLAKLQRLTRHKDPEIALEAAKAISSYSLGMMRLLLAPAAARTAPGPSGGKEMRQPGLWEFKDSEFPTE